MLSQVALCLHGRAGIAGRVAQFFLTMVDVVHEDSDDECDEEEENEEEEEEEEVEMSIEDHI